MKIFLYELIEIKDGIQRLLRLFLSKDAVQDFVNNKNDNKIYDIRKREYETSRLILSPINYAGGNSWYPLPEYLSIGSWNDFDNFPIKLLKKEWILFYKEAITYCNVALDPTRLIIIGNTFYYKAISKDEVLIIIDSEAKKADIEYSQTVKAKVSFLGNDSYIKQILNTQKTPVQTLIKEDEKIIEEKEDKVDLRDLYKRIVDDRYSYDVIHHRMKSNIEMISKYQSWSEEQQKNFIRSLLFEHISRVSTCRDNDMIYLFVNSYVDMYFKS